MPIDSDSSVPADVLGTWYDSQGKVTSSVWPYFGRCILPGAACDADLKSVSRFVSLWEVTPPFGRNLTRVAHNDSWTKCDGWCRSRYFALLPMFLKLGSGGYRSIAFSFTHRFSLEICLISFFAYNYRFWNFESIWDVYHRSRKNRDAADVRAWLGAQF